MDIHQVLFELILFNSDLHCVIVSRLGSCRPADKECTQKAEIGVTEVVEEDEESEKKCLGNSRR